MSTLLSVGPSNSSTRKGPDNRRDDDATFDVLPSQKPSIVQIESSLTSGGIVLTSIGDGKMATTVDSPFHFLDKTDHTGQ